MDIKEIQNLIKFVAKSGAYEVEIEKKDFKITMDPEFDPKEIEHDLLEGVAIEIDQEITPAQLAYDTYAN